MGGSGFHFPDVAQELNVRLVESCHLLARLCGDKKVIIWGQGHLLGMDRFPQNATHTCTLRQACTYFFYIL